MSGKRNRRQKAGDRNTSARPSSTGWAVLLPILVAIVLCLPCLGLGYIWDDYYFLTFHGQGDYRTYLLPNQHTAFYRPISQGLYFLLLRIADPANGVLAHTLNLAALAAAVALLVLLISRLCGRRAGLFSGLAFASLGCVPSLVAWVSCSQDLLAIALVLAAFLLRDQRKEVLAIACVSAAVLCKEPAIAAFPVLALWDRIVGRPSPRFWPRIAAYAAVAVLWILVHPGLHLLAGRGFRSGATGYVGVEHPERWGRYLVRYLLTLMNVPPAERVTWWESRLPYGLVALGLLVGGLLFLDRWLPRGRHAKSLSLGRVAWIAGLFAIPTLLMPVVFVRHWAPYFACIPAVGFAIFVGPVLARQRALVVTTVLGAFLMLGVRYRGLRVENEPVWSERVFAEAADAVRAVRGNFRTVLPSLQRGSQVALSVETTGVRGIRATLLEGQALRVWYGDPGLHAVDVLNRRPEAVADYLVRVTTDLDVISIDPDAHRVKASRPDVADMTQVGRPLRNYARALAAGGDPDRAIRVMEWFTELESDWGKVYGERLTAMILLNAGRREEAAKILATAPEFPREDALAVVRRLLAEPSESEQLDDAAFEAFGLSTTDPEAIRWIMRDFMHDGAVAQAAWYAQRLQRLAPRDPESLEAIRTAERMGVTPRRTVT
jgi:hypothetical protein